MATSRCSSSDPPPTSVRLEDPTLTTRRRARATSPRRSAALMPPRSFLGVLVLRGGPVAGPSLGGQLVARDGPGDPALGVVGALVVTGRAVGVLEPQVGATGAEQLGTGHEGRLPVEDHGVVLGPDEHGRPSDRTSLEEGLLDAGS